MRTLNHYQSAYPGPESIPELKDAHDKLLAQYSEFLKSIELYCHKHNTVIAFDCYVYDPDVGGWSSL